MEIKFEELEVIGARCLVEEYGGAKKTTSGIELPEKETQATSVLGTVVKAGVESKFKVGDIIFYRRYSVDTLPFTTESGPKEYSLVEDDEVCVVKRHA